mgnify:FL=1|jgi:hypothetical protein
MATVSIHNDLIKKTLRSVMMQKRTVEEIQEAFTNLYPPVFLFRGSPSVTISNLTWALAYLVKEEYVDQEVTRYLEKPLKHDTKVYSLSSKGVAYLSKKR